MIAKIATPGISPINNLIAADPALGAVALVAIIALYFMFKLASRSLRGDK
jgi:hypothetical protein